MGDGPRDSKSSGRSEQDPDRIAEDMRRQIDHAREVTRGYRRALESVAERKPGRKPPRN